MTIHKANNARERVLNTAEALFHQHGYQAVSMRDVARELGIKQASLYYHMPKGKEQLFAEITRRGLLRHRTGLAQAITQASPTLQSRLMAIVEWLISQPPLKLLAMFEADMQALSLETQQSLMSLAYQSLFGPIADVFEEAVAQGEIRTFDVNHLAGIFLSMMDGIMYANRAGHNETSLYQTAASTVDLMLFGLVDRPETQIHTIKGAVSPCTN